MLNLDPAPKVITFDCYGTLVQWQRAVREASGIILARRFRAADVERLLGVARIGKLLGDRPEQRAHSARAK